MNRDLSRLYIARFRGHSSTREESQRMRISLLRRIDDPDIMWLADYDTDYTAVDLGNGQARCLINRSVKEFVNIKIESMWKHKRKGFPGSLAVSMMKADIDELKPGDYAVLAKTDGERYMVVCFLDADNRPNCVLIERTGEMYLVQVSMRREIFHGGIYDAELAKDLSGTWKLFLFDAIVHQGRKVWQLDYDERLAACSEVVDMSHNHNPNRCFDIRSKIIQPLDRVQRIMDEKNDGECATDGIIMVKLKSPYTAGKDTTLFKLKTHHTVDYKIVVDANNEVQMCAIDSENKTLVCHQFIEPSQELMSKLGVTSAVHLSGMVVECEWDAEGEKWNPIKPRAKNRPNNTWTIARTKSNIEEDVRWCMVQEKLNGSLL